uniref:Nudix (nucleoside diphosphate linked moiety X)-type motif 8 n=1 Tax=Salarias fasciatus TaxID=181472 RepID=A0A672IR60_SALFA
MDGSGKDHNVSARTVRSFIQISSSISDCDKYHPTENSSQSILSKANPLKHPHHPQDSAAAKTKQASDLVSTYLDCLFNVTGLGSRRRFWDFCQPSLSKTYLHHMQHFVRPVCLSTHTPWISNLHSKSQLPLLRQSRAAHQVAPRMENTWRDCLSPVNEDRCRQILEPNLKLYQMEKGTRWASVLASLCSVEGEPAFLFTLRSSTLKGRHKGDVSFAGGKSDPSDRDVVTTALREAKEELGVTVAAEQVWGVLKPLRDVTGMMVAPVLANLGPLEELTFKPNPGEVEEIFTISLSHLCNPKNRGYTHFRVGSKYAYTLPVFPNGKHRVWGLTAVALEQTLKVIVPR